MNERLLEWLACPDCGSSFKLASSIERGGEVEDGELVCDGGHRFPIVKGIPRFVPKENYATNFGLQWARFGKVQIDSYAKNSISRDRFVATTDWDERSIKGKLVVDGGCGGGRFAEIALSLGADVIAVDFSNAIDACRANLESDRLHLIQADIASLPLKRGIADAAYSLGVLQHTPNAKGSIGGLVRVVRPGGQVIVDCYGDHYLRYLNSIYWYRPLLKRVPPTLLMPLIEGLVRALHPFKSAIMSRFSKNPFMAVAASMIFPINSHHYQFPFLSEEQALQWAILSTFDAYSPVYDSPQTLGKLEALATELGLRSVETFLRPGHGDGTPLVCRGLVGEDGSARTAA